MPIPQGNENIYRKSAKQTVYETVCGWIIAGVLAPGEKILDSELAAYFHVSRTPVREALQVLQNQGFVSVIPGKATVVAALDLKDLEKCYRPLAEIDALAAEQACGRLTEQDFFELEYELRAAAQAGERGDAEAVFVHDERFHEILVDAADNEYIAEFSHTMVLHIQRIRYHYFHVAKMRKTSALQHAGILEALRAKDAKLAKERMREHWLSAMEGSLAEVLEMERAQQERGTETN